MDQMFTREEVEEVASWLKSPTLEKVIALLEKGHVVAWLEAKSVEDREFCWKMIQCLRLLHEELRLVVDEQKVDQFNRTRARANDWRMPTPEERM